MAHFGRIADDGGCAAVVDFEECRRVDGDGFVDDACGGAVGVFGFGVVEICDGDAHAVAGQSAGLVCADDCRGAHGFAGVKLAHEVVAGEHAPHAQGETQRDAHGETFGYRDDDEGDGEHDCRQQIVGDLDGRGGRPSRR